MTDLDSARDIDLTLLCLEGRVKILVVSGLQSHEIVDSEKTSPHVYIANFRQRLFSGMPKKTSAQFMLNEFILFFLWI